MSRYSDITRHHKNGGYSNSGNVNLATNATTNTSGSGSHSTSMSTLYPQELIQMHPHQILICWVPKSMDKGRDIYNHYYHKDMALMMKDIAFASISTGIRTVDRQKTQVFRRIIKLGLPSYNTSVR